MKISLQKEKGSKIYLRGELSPLEFNDYYKRAKENLRKKVQVKGFRKGEAPEEILQEHKKEEEILREASSLAIKDIYLKTLRKEKFEPIGEPLAKIEKLSKEEGLVFNLNFYILPQLSLPDYRKIAKEIKREKIEVEDKEIEEALNWLRKSRSKITPLERESKEGDLVEIEYSSPQIEGGRIFQDRFILGRGGFAKNFEKEIEGMKKGENKRVDISFPHDYHDKRLAGKEAKINVTLKGVFQVETPDLNDEFAKNLGRFNNLEDLKKSIREGIYLEKMEQENKRLLDIFFQKITKITSFEIPDLLLKIEKERLLKSIKEEVKRDLNLEFDDYLEKIKKTPEEFSQSLSEIARNNIERWLIMREICREENLEASDQEIEERINEILKNYGDLERAKKEIDFERLKNYTREEIKNQKVLEFLLGLIT